MKKIILYAAFIQSLIATSGSLYFSEIMKLTPCTLCWYQRICMYPIAIIMLIGLYNKDTNVHKYVIPFSLTGLLITIYHNLLIYGILSDPIVACSLQETCSITIRKWFGFITIPLLSLTAFTVINILMILYMKMKAIDAQPKI